MDNSTPFRTFGTMLDCSRNAVPNLHTLKKWVDLTASLGLQYSAFVHRGYLRGDRRAVFWLYARTLFTGGSCANWTHMPTSAV